MKKKYLYNGQIIPEDVVMEAAKQNNVDVDTYIQKAGIKSIEDSYAYNGKNIPSEIILEAANQQKLGFDDYIQKGGFTIPEKKNQVGTEDLYSGKRPSSYPLQKQASNFKVPLNLGENQNKQPEAPQTPQETFDPLGFLNKDIQAKGQSIKPDMDAGMQLAAYHSERQKDFNTQKAVLGSEILNNYQDVNIRKGDIGAGIKLDIKKPLVPEQESNIDKLHRQINDIKDYENKFNASVKHAASIYAGSKTNDPVAAGRIVRGILGDKRAAIEGKYEDKIAPSTQYYNARQGLDALQTALEAKYQDKTDPDYLAQKSDLDNQSANLLDKYPEFKQQQIAKVIVQEIMKDHPNATGMAVLGYAKDAIKKLNLPEEDVKNIDLDNLPIQSIGSSILGGIYNAALKVGAGIARVGGTPFLSKDYLDATLSDALRKGEERFTDISGLQGSPTIVDSNPKSKTYLQDIENTDKGKYNYNFHTISNAIGSGIGNLVGIVGGTKGAGSIAKSIAPGIAEATAADVGMAATMIGQGYEPYYQKAREVVSDKPKDEWKRHFYALWSGSVDWAVFKPLGKLQEAISPAAARELGAILKDAPSLEAVNKKLLTKLTANVLKGAESTIGETAKIGAAQVSGEIAKDIVDNLVGDKKTEDLGENIERGLVDLPFTMMIPLGLGEFAKGVRASHVFKENIYNAGLHPETYLGQANDLLQKGRITQDQYNKRLQVINTSKDIVISIPEDLGLNHNQKVEYTNSKLRELALQAKADKIGDASLEKYYKDKISDEVKNRISIIEGNGKEPDFISSQTKSQQNASTQSEGQQQGGDNQGGSQEYARTEQVGGQEKESGAKSGDSLLGSERGQEAQLIKQAVDNADVVKNTIYKNILKEGDPNTVSDVLKEVSDQWHDEGTRTKTEEVFGKEVVEAAIKLHPQESQKSLSVPEKQSVDTRTDKNFGDKTIETDKAVMQGSYGDEVTINDEQVKLPKTGFLISDVNLKEGVEKGKGSGQEIYKQALDKYGTLYSAHPISGDALNAQNALEKKGLVTIRNEEIGGQDFRVIEKKSSVDTPTDAVSSKVEGSGSVKKEGVDFVLNTEFLGKIKGEKIGEIITKKNGEYFYTVGGEETKIPDQKRAEEAFNDAAKYVEERQTLPTQEVKVSTPTKEDVVDSKTKQQLLDERLDKIKEIKDKAEGTREERTKRYNELLNELGDETAALKKLQSEITDRAKSEIDKLPALPKTENDIINEKGESDFEKINKDLGFKPNDYKWGKSPMDEDMGDMLLSKDKESVIFIKPNEVEIYDEKNDQTDTVTNGIKIELVSTKENSRGKGKAKEMVQKVTDWADKNGTDLYLDIAPQDKSTTESGLKKLYESFGFEFDGIHGKRKPKEDVKSVDVGIGDNNKNIEKVIADKVKDGDLTETEGRFISSASERAYDIDVDSVIKMADKIAKHDKNDRKLEHVAEAVQYEIAKKEPSFGRLDSDQFRQAVEGKTVYMGNIERMQELGILPKEGKRDIELLKEFQLKKSELNLPTPAQRLLEIAISRHIIDDKATNQREAIKEGLSLLNDIKDNEGKLMVSKSPKERNIKVKADLTTVVADQIGKHLDALENKQKSKPKEVSIEGKGKEPAPEKVSERTEEEIKQISREKILDPEKMEQKVEIPDINSFNAETKELSLKKVKSIDARDELRKRLKDIEKIIKCL